jgi:SNF2 family DNA or RNA helicase
MKFKLPPMAHQKTALKRCADNPEAFALLMEQRTGKTKVVIDLSAIRFLDGLIDNLFVLAPNVVHIKWVEDEIPKHMSDDVPYVAKFYRTGRKNLPMPFVEGKLRILTMSFDSFITKEGFAYAMAFCKSGKTMGALDESHRIKDSKTARAGKAYKLAPLLHYRIILTGTLTPNGPFDAWSQFVFLDPKILDQTFSAFKSTYSQLLTTNSWLMRHLLQGRKDIQKIVPRDENGKPQYDKLPEHVLKRLPAITAKDADGNPVYRNLEKLNKIIAPYSYRVLRKDCFDLPPKVYDVLSFEMTDYQQQVYHQIKTELRAEFGDKIMLPANKLVAMTRLQQITSGILMMEGDEAATMMFDDDDNPRLIALRSLLEDQKDQGIIWARYNVEIDSIMNILGDNAIQYDGRVKPSTRSQRITDFQSGKRQYFVAKAQSGGTGLTLFAAKWHIYHSNTFNLEHRLQSEDRAEGIGQTESVQITDIRCLNSIDLRIVSALQSKQEVSRIITGDDL